MARIRITAGEVSQTATLNSSLTAGKLMGILPVTAKANVWGQEIYFNVPLHMGPEEPAARVPSGTIAYWPEGPSMCIFFGQVPYSPVNVVGRLDGNADDFAKVRAGQDVRVEAVA